MHLRFMLLRWVEIKRPHGSCFPNAVRKNFLGWRLPIEGGTKISATGVGELWLCLGVLCLRSLPNNRMDLDSGITNPTSLRTSFAREFQTKPQQVLSQKNMHTHGPTGTIAGGAHNRTFFQCAFVFLPAILGC